jgi:hypothetical protein
MADLKTADSVDQQDLNKVDPVNQQDLNNTDSVDQGKQDDKLSDGTDANKTVKYADLKKATERATAAEEQAAYAQRQLELYQQTQTATQQPVAQPQVGSTYEMAMKELGYTTDDLYDGNAQLKIQNRKYELDAILTQQQNANVATQQFVASHPDFSQVVGSVNPATGTIMAWSAEALALQQKKPWLSGAFNTAEGAYNAVMSERTLLDLEKKDAANQEFLKRQGVDLNTNPLGASSAGSGAGDPQNQSLMSRDEVAEIQRKLAAGESVQ